MSTDGLPGGEFRPSGPTEDASSVLKTIYFDFDKADVRPDQQSILDGNADYLKQNADVKVQIEGHCDERGTNEYNLALGERRSESAKKFLTDLGLAASRFTTISYGEEKPLDTGKTEVAWSKNRRAHFVVK